MERCFQHSQGWAVQFLCIAVFFWSSHELLAFDPYRQSVRSLGAAGAYSAIVDDESSFYLNPAGLSRNAEARKFSISGEFQEGIRQNWGLQTSLIDGLTEDPIHWGFLFDMQRTEASKFYDYILASSYNYNGYLMFGIQNRIVNFNRASATSEFTGFAMSAGVLGVLGEHLTLAANVQNFVRTQKNSDYLPWSFGFGGSFNWEWLRANFEFKRDQSNAVNFGQVGGELLAGEHLILRGGYVSDLNGEYRGYSAGASLMASERFSLDGAFFDQLDSDFYLVSAGLSVRFD